MANPFVPRESIFSSPKDGDGYEQGIETTVQVGPKRPSTRQPSGLANLPMCLSNEQPPISNRRFGLSHGLLRCADFPASASGIQRICRISRQRTNATAKEIF